MFEMSKHESHDMLWIAIPHFALGALGIGVTIWGSQDPDQATPKVSLRPLVLADNQGQPAVGVGLGVVGW